MSNELRYAIMFGSAATMLVAVAAAYFAYMRGDKDNDDTYTTAAMIFILGAFLFGIGFGG